jgi:hypothetical protein
MRAAADARTSGKPIWDAVGALRGATCADLDLPFRAIHRVVSRLGTGCAAQGRNKAIG